MESVIARWDRPLRPLVRALLAVLTLLWLTSTGAAFGASQLAETTAAAANSAVATASLPSHLPPSDAPRIDTQAIRRPDPPAGFKDHDAGWIHFAYPPEARQKIQRLIEIADATRQELSSRLGAPVLGELHVRIARTAGEMTTLAPSNAPYPKYATGVAYPDLRLVLITLDPRHPNERHDIVQTFQHELAHVALYDAVKGHDVPRWFNEGFAVFVSGEGSIPRLQTLWTATLAGNIIPLERLERSFPDDAILASIAYAEAADVVRYLVRTQEQYRFDGLVERIARGMDFDQALLGAYGIDRMSLESEWREDIARRYTFWPVLTGSTALWVGIVGLFFWAYRRRRVRDRRILERWRREEATEDALLAAARAEQRIHIVVAQPGSSLSTPPPRPMPNGDADVPKIEHGGSLHTLH